jgi:plastocyanin
VRYLALVLLLVAAPAFAGKKKAKKPKTGSITGVVTTTLGTHKATGDRSNDEYCKSQTPEAHLEVDSPDGYVKGVYVRIKNGTFPAATAPEEPVVITQSKCEYRPMIVGVIEGQTLEVRNDDPTFHNVRIIGTDKKTLTNKPQQKGAPPITTETIDGDGVVELHCDVHPWMEAYAVVSDHAHWTFTDARGRFELPGLAPGTYTVETWHPDLGWKTTKLKLKKGKKSVKAKVHYDLDDCGGC